MLGWAGRSSKQMVAGLPAAQCDHGWFQVSDSAAMGGSNGPAYRFGGGQGGRSRPFTRSLLENPPADLGAHSPPANVAREAEGGPVGRLPPPSPSRTWRPSLDDRTGALTCQITIMWSPSRGSTGPASPRSATGSRATRPTSWQSTSYRGLLGGTAGGKVRGRPPGILVLIPTRRS